MGILSENEEDKSLRTTSVSSNQPAMKALGKVESTPKVPDEVIPGESEYVPTPQSDTLERPRYPWEDEYKKFESVVFSPKKKKAYINPWDGEKAAKNGVVGIKEREARLQKEKELEREQRLERQELQLKLIRAELEEANTRLITIEANTIPLSKRLFG